MQLKESVMATLEGNFSNVGTEKKEEEKDLEGQPWSTHRKRPSFPNWEPSKGWLEVPFPSSVYSLVFRTVSQNT